MKILLFLALSLLTLSAFASEEQEIIERLTKRVTSHLNKVTTSKPDFDCKNTSALAIFPDFSHKWRFVFECKNSSSSSIKVVLKTDYMNPELIESFKIKGSEI